MVHTTRSIQEFVDKQWEWMAQENVTKLVLPFVKFTALMSW